MIQRQLEGLVMLQELDALLAELDGVEARERETALGFALGETDRLRAARAEIARGLPPDWLAHYERVRQRHARAVVPANRGTCMGCFTMRPRSMATRQGGLEGCERCGRILYRIDEPATPAAGPRAEPPSPVAKAAKTVRRRSPRAR